MGDYKLFQKISNHINEERRAMLSKTSAEFQCLVKQVIHSSSVTKTGIENEYKKVLTEDVPSAFFKRYEPDLKKVMDLRLIPLFYYEIDRVKEYQYDDSMERRNLRSTNYVTYIRKIKEILEEFIKFSILGVDMNDYLTGKVSEEILAFRDQYSYPNFPFVIAAIIDSGDTKIRGTIEDIVTGTGGKVSIELIRGVFLSKDTKMYELMEKLLLAARLQEGLRQAVCENMDFGSIEAFEYMFKVIIDNDLLRFSSVQRAIEVTTGLVRPEERGGDRITKKQCDFIGRFLSDPSSREASLSGTDHMEIYLALWAIGTRSMDDAVRRARELVLDGGREQKLSAAFFLKNYLGGTKTYLNIFEAKSDDLEVIAILMPSFMPGCHGAVFKAIRNDDMPYGEFLFNRVFAEPSYYFKDAEESKKAYFILKKIYETIPQKKIEYQGLVFPWYNVTLTKSSVIDRMVYCASASLDRKLTLEVARDLSVIDNYQRVSALVLLLNEPSDKEEYEILTKAIGEADESTRSQANKMLLHELERDTDDPGLDPEIRAGKGKLPSFCYDILEEGLKSKKGDVRLYSISLLMTLDDDKKLELIGRLLGDKKEEKRAAGLDMIMRLKKDESPLFSEAAGKVSIITAPTTKEQVLIEEITGSQEDAGKEENESASFYDPKASYEPVFDMEKIKGYNAVWDRVFPNKKIGKGLLSIRKKFDDHKIIRALDDLIEKNKDLEYEYAGQTYLIGYAIHLRHHDEKTTVPYNEIWDSFYEENIKSADELVRLSFLIALSTDRRDRAQYNPKGYISFCEKYIKEYMGPEFDLLNTKDYKHYASLDSVICYLGAGHGFGKIKSDIGLAIAYHIACSKDPMLFTFTKKDLGNDLKTNLDKDVFTRTPLTDKSFEFFLGSIENGSDSFPIRYALCEKFDGNYVKDNVLWNYSTIYGNTSDKKDEPRLSEYIKACANGLISKDFLYKRFFDGFEGKALDLLTSAIIYIKERNDSRSTRINTSSYRINSVVRSLLNNDYDNDPDPEKLTEGEKKTLALTGECYENFVPFCVDRELRRGDSPTEYSQYMKFVKRLYGLKYFVGILKAFGKDTFDRSKYLSYSNGASKQGVLSGLLAVCVPDDREGDTKEQAAKLREMIKGTDITEQRLIEAGLFAPEWLEIIGEYLGMEGFRSGCYYFMAHMNERFDEKRTATIAKFSPISPEEFNAGAFDKNWFDEVYEVLGPKKFNEIYDAAKYISDGSKHARARKYADAATGKLDPQKTRDEIEKKRNKDLLMAYAIIPGSDKELQGRYTYIRQFIKESRKFGAQRRASEKLAGETAIKNMATAQGYIDETRFILKMENEIASGLSSLWELQDAGDYRMCLCVSSGKVDIRILKDGKELKSIPSALKKDETVLELQEAKKTFTEQYRRTRIMFEEAMESRTPFRKEELDALRENPVLTDMVNSLVFECDGRFGLLKDLEVSADADVYVAHSYTMFKAGVWRDMQALIFDNGIVQPFKQVFRELYVKTKEEEDRFDSERYAGNQIQAKKTVAVLKGRRWIADVEAGLQKVYYKENIIATIYALADWFSPSDIEDPTLEWVAFYDRKTGKGIKIKDVPDIIFSEVMRDVDLAVSVAHAGEVDPEMSHSTIEMRHAVAEFTCRSFKLDNVTFTASHALIKGTRGNYSVHLGSGVIHLEGGLMINVLPVHSQKRGRIFLPFVDDDPKTAEIISKILLFAEDKKIKDPFILDQIV